MTDLRLLSYNVRSLRDDAAAVARVIRACAPDVVCIQEAPRFFRWRSKCAALARESGLVVVTGGRHAGAMLLLARLGVEVDAAYDVLLSKAPKLHQRGLAVGVLRVNGARVAVASMHLDLDAAERRKHVDEVFAHLDGLRAGAPVVVAGDVNEEPGHPAWDALAARLQDAHAVAPEGGSFTYSSRRRFERIDGVFADPAIEVLGCGVPDGIPEGDTAAATDHLPLLARLRLPDEPG